MLDLVKNYKLIILPLVVVVILDLSLLIMNYLISAELEVVSEQINIAGRQRMLSQKIMKDLALIDFKLRRDESYSEHKQELQESVHLFDQTLKAFLNGGEATSASGISIHVDRQSGKTIRATLEQATRLWEPICYNLNKIIDNGIYPKEIDDLIINLSEANASLLGLVNDITNQFETKAKQKTYLLRALQTLVVIMILAAFTIATLRLIRRERYYNKLMENSADILLGIDVFDHNVRFISASVDTLLQNHRRYYLGKPAVRLFSFRTKSTLLTCLAYARENRRLEQERCDIELVAKDGTIIPAEMIMQLSESLNGKSLELMADIRDISERKRSELALYDLAHKDMLTGLANRVSFEIMAGNIINIAKQSKNNIALLFIDLDGFKLINDAYGHQVGDEMLSQVARRIERNLRTTDSVSRIGGDEFVILLDKITNRHDISLIGNKIIQSLAEEMIIGKHVCKISASIGIAIYPEHGNNITELTKKADAAMYKVKASGKNSIGFAEAKIKIPRTQSELP
jgi:diguanylate cyclase (GGDEF)-like protein/PAS domain S-box-containing protein